MEAFHYDVETGQGIMAPCCERGIREWLEGVLESHLLGHPFFEIELIGTHLIYVTSVRDASEVRDVIKTIGLLAVGGMKQAIVCDRGRALHEFNINIKRLELNEVGGRRMSGTRSRYRFQNAIILVCDVHQSAYFGKVLS